MTSIYEIPDNITQLFSNQCASYRIIEYEKEMDNIQSMQHFIECVGIPEENIEINDGTQLVLKHNDFSSFLVVDAGGLGDFFSHSFEVSEYNYG